MSPVYSNGICLHWKWILDKTKKKHFIYFGVQTFHEFRSICNEIKLMFVPCLLILYDFNVDYYYLSIINILATDTA